MNIDSRYLEKSQKYAHFVTDITGYKCSVNCFEISSTGMINARNKQTLSNLHRLMSRNISKATFLQNLNALAWYGSYQIWLTCDNPEFLVPTFLIPYLGGVTGGGGERGGGRGGVEDHEECHPRLEGDVRPSTLRTHGI